MDQDYGSNYNKPDITSDEIGLTRHKYTEQNLKLDSASTVTNEELLLQY